MKTVVKDLGPCKKRIEITLTDEEIEPYIQKAYAKAQKNMRLDGFRAGKVPLSLIKKRFGEVIKHDSADDIIQAYYVKAIAAEALDVVAPGQVGKVVFEENKPFSFEAEVEVQPEFEAVGYTGLKAEKEKQKVTDEDVNQYMTLLQDQSAEIKEIKAGAEKGDIVSGDVQELNAAGVPIVGKKFPDWNVELGKAPVGDQVLDQLTGALTGEERRFSITAPVKDEGGKVQNQQSHYLITITKVSEKILPELNDDFARKREFESLSDMKLKIRETFEAESEARAERNLRNSLIDELVKRHHFEVPVSMVENGLNHLWEDYQKQPQSQQRQQIDQETFFSENRAGVVWNIKWSYIWRKIAETESFEITESETDTEVDRMAKASAKDEKKIRIFYKDKAGRDRLKDRMLEEKVLSHIRENAKIKESVLKPTKKSKIIS